MNVPDLIERGRACLRHNPGCCGSVKSDKPSLRFVVHVLRGDIEDQRREHQTWAQIASHICAEFQFECEDPKEKGRVVAEYHSQPLSKVAATALQRAQVLNSKIRKANPDALRVSAHGGVATPPVQGPDSVDPFSLD